MTRDLIPSRDFEEILFESIPLAPEPFPSVAETFISRTELSPAQARAAFFGIILALLMPEDEKESLSENQVSIIQVFFSDRRSDGWQPLDAFILTQLTECWSKDARLPREGVLLKRAFDPARINAAALKIA